MPPALAGRILLNQYRIEEFAAVTPLGELYRALDLYRNKFLALTVLPKPFAEKIESIKELETHSNTLRGLSHPNLIPYLGLFQTPTLAFLLEEWVEGPSLGEVLNKTPAGPYEALIFAKALCSGLAVLHKQNLAHLNLAPELIRINKGGDILLGGIAAARQFGDRTYTINNKYPALYRAPEHFLAQPVYAAADTYSLAVLVYQLLTGVWINGKAAPKTAEAVRRTHLEVIPPAPITLLRDLPDHLSRMVLWALRKKPDDRLKTTTELLSSLALAVDLSVDAIPSRADPKTAPVSADILSGWAFLPPQKQSLVSQDTAPLEDRLASLLPDQPKIRRGRIGVLPIIIFMMLSGLISLFWLVRPAPEPVALPNQFTPFASDYTPPPTRTPLPKPTEEHGGRIAFTCTRGDFNQICMVNRDGTGLTQLTDMEASNYYPVFSPDGSSLLFASNRNGAFDLYLLAFEEKQLYQLTENVGNVITPDYSPDGRTIVFANRVGSDPTSIWMVNADGLNPRRVYQGTDVIVAVAWSPAGDKIAYAMSVGIPLEYEIFTMDANGKNHLRISQGLKGIGGSLDWSPDGQNVLVYAGPYLDKDIFRIDAANGRFAQLTDGGNNAGGSYSPDGRYIVFNSMRNDDQADLYIMRADGTNPQQLTNHPEPDWDAHWSP
jgi:Tol biopolymer transport system component